jgi:hypothetical protein
MNNHKENIKQLCYLITATLNTLQLTDKEKYEIIKKHAVKIELEAEDKLARC